MNIEEYEKEYKRVNECGDNIAEILKFKKILLSDNSPDICNYHYGLLRRRDNMKLYLHIRAAFMDRPNIEEFLLKKLQVENDDRLQADILQILGTIRSSHAVRIARDFINHRNEYHREVASFVLGWVGNKDDIQLLNKHMLNENTTLLRITAASAHRQIAWRIPDIKMNIVYSLKQGFENECSDEVLPWIIIMIETIMVKNLGIREDKQQPDIWHGDLEKAKKKTAQYLATLDFNNNK